VVGNASSNFWLFQKEREFDLTHPPAPDGPTVSPQFQLSTSTAPIIVAPEKGALVIIDMQNYFLSDGMNNPRRPAHDAKDLLLSDAIPAAGIQTIHVTWGITDAELAVLPPVILRIFGFGETSEIWANYDVEHGAEKAYPFVLWRGRLHRRRQVSRRLNDAGWPPPDA
jgi:hypothetical protein